VPGSNDEIAQSGSGANSVFAVDSGGVDSAGVARRPGFCRRR
jgi:hypothetical protein